MDLLLSLPSLLVPFICFALSVVSFHAYTQTHTSNKSPSWLKWQWTAFAFVNRPVDTRSKHNQSELGGALREFMGIPVSQSDNLGRMHPPSVLPFIHSEARRNVLKFLEIQLREPKSERQGWWAIKIRQVMLCDIWKRQQQSDKVDVTTQVFWGLISSGFRLSPSWPRQTCVICARGEDQH